MGVDYTTTFPPVAKMTIVRTLLALVMAKQWHLQQLYINNTFLHKDMQEEFYMKLVLVLKLLAITKFVDIKNLPID